MDTDLHSKLFAVNALVPTDSADDTPLVSSIIDTKGFYSLEFITTLGTVFAAATFAVTVEHGNDPALADATTVDANFLLGDGSFADTDANGVKRLGYVGESKRYVRYTVTPTGNGATTQLAITAVLAKPRHAPTDEN